MECLSDTIQAYGGTILIFNLDLAHCSAAFGVFASCRVVSQAQWLKHRLSKAGKYTRELFLVSN